MFTQPQPIDLTNNFNNIPHDVDLPFLPRTSEGIQLSNNFPDEKRFKGKSEWILVRGDEESVFTRPTEYSAVLEKGTILVSVRRPSETGLVKTPIGDVALHSDGDVMLTWTGGVLRICNLSALGSNCKAKFDNKIFGDGKSQTVVLKPGFEAVASVDHKLGRADLRPSDGIARRRANLLADGHLGVSEFSLQSLLQTSAVIAHLQAANNAKDTRVLAQMSKMAAVLNAVNSPYGYTQEGQTGVASNPQAH